MLKNRKSTDKQKQKPANKTKTKTKQNKQRETNLNYYCNDSIHFISTKSFVWTESLWGFLNESILNPDKVFKCLAIWRKRRHLSNSEGFGAKFKWNLVYKLHPQIVSFKTMVLKVCRFFIASRVGKSRVYMKSMQTAIVQSSKMDSWTL